MQDGIRIDRIEQTKQGRMALFSGEEFLFSVDTETYFSEHLSPGMSCTGEELEQLWEKSQLRKAKDKALQYLSLRDYASGELYGKLNQKFDDRACSGAVAAMCELGLIDDLSFARHRAVYLMKQNKSRSQVRHHLSEKGLDRLTIDEVLEELYQTEDDSSPELQAALNLVQKSYGPKLRAGKRENVLAALARRGFSLSTAREAIDCWQQEQEAGEPV